VKRIALVALALAGCNARPQWTVSIATDAPVPQLGDRLLVEILDDTGAPACTGCRRQLGAADPASWPVSFGVVAPEPAARLRVRARLYRPDQTGPDGLPATTTLLDALGVLPSPSGDTHVALTLMTSCFGVPSDPAGDTTCDPSTGAIAPITTMPAADAQPLPSPGDWAPGRSVPCPAAPPAGMVCIPGGAFLLGGSRSFPFDDFLRSLPEHLVQLSPFALDADELTVGQLRAIAGQLPSEPDLRLPDLRAYHGECTWLGAGDPTDDALPVNCIPLDLAAVACAALGKRLPTEAEWEYAAGNLSTESEYPWGGDADVCGHAVIGLGRAPAEVDSPTDVEFSDCRAAGTGQPKPFGPVAGGSPADVTALGVRNLGGNMSEWVDGALASYSDACWNRGTLLVDPVCNEAAPGHTGQHPIRGGSWAGLTIQAQVVNRNNTLNDGGDPFTGVRCAKSF
jgi:formylglycine-generating enzyme required for sulfatase activity